MASPTKLHGLELIDCAKANAKQGIETAARQCGYGQDIKTFQQELKQACNDINVTYNELTDLITDQENMIQMGGVEVAPETTSEL